MYDLGKNLVQGNVDALPSLITHDPEKEKQEAQALIDEFNTQVVNGDSDSIMKYTGGIVIPMLVTRGISKIPVKGVKSVTSGVSEDAVTASKNVVKDVSKGAVAPSLLKTESNSAFFWSGRTDGIGGAERALEIAKQQQGGTTLEGLIESKGIKMPEWDINNSSSIKAWEDVSATYANNVSGNVRAVVGSNLREGNIWENVELPRLKNNPNVTQITTIDPKTLIETVIFKR